MDQKDNKTADEILKDAEKYPQRALENTDDTKTDKENNEQMLIPPQPIFMTTYAGPGFMNGRGFMINEPVIEPMPKDDAQTTDPLLIKDGKVCKMCGNVNPAEAKFCTECGSIFENAADKE